MVVFLGFYAAAELSHFVEIVPRVPVSAVKWKKFGKKGFKIWSNACILRIYELLAEPGRVALTPAQR
jgi:hypothetical protein